MDTPTPETLPMYEVLVTPPGTYDPISHPFATHSDALHYYAECTEGGFQAIYVNREGDEPVVTGLLSQPIEAWTTAEMRELFEVHEFSAPFVVVRRRSDNAKGTLTFIHSPRYYFGWVAE